MDILTSISESWQNRKAKGCSKSSRSLLSSRLSCALSKSAHRFIWSDSPIASSSWLICCRARSSFLPPSVVRIAFNDAPLADLFEDGEQDSVFQKMDSSERSWWSRASESGRIIWALEKAEWSFRSSAKNARAPGENGTRSVHIAAWYSYASCALCMHEICT